MIKVGQIYNNWGTLFRIDRIIAKKSPYSNVVYSLRLPNGNYGGEYHWAVSAIEKAIVDGDVKRDYSSKIEEEIKVWLTK